MKVRRTLHILFFFYFSARTQIKCKNTKGKHKIHTLLTPLPLLLLPLLLLLFYFSARVRSTVRSALSFFANCYFEEDTSWSLNTEEDTWTLNEMVEKKIVKKMNTWCDVNWWEPRGEKNWNAKNEKRLYENTTKRNWRKSQRKWKISRNVWKWRMNYWFFLPTPLFGKPAEWKLYYVLLEKTDFGCGEGCGGEILN